MRVIVIRPHITELSMKDASKGKFTFLVAPEATKTEIKNEVQSLYKVTVTGVYTVNLRRSKVVNTKFGRKSTFKKIKKARVELQKGQTISAFEIPEEKETKKKPSSAKASEGQRKK